MMQTLKDQWEHFKITASRSILDVRRGIHHTSWHHIFLVIIGCSMSIFGMGMQIVSLNDWLNAFPDQYKGYPAGGPLSVLIVASLFVFLAFSCSTIYFIIKNKPSLKCLKNPYVHLHGAAGGLCFALNGLLVVYATPHVSEVLQALLTAAQLIFTLFFSIVFHVNKGKNYCHFLTVTAVLLSCGGIALGSLATNSSGADQRTFPDAGAWATMFALGICPGSLTVVVSASMLQRCSFDPDEDEDIWSEDTDDSSIQASTASPPPPPDAAETDPMLNKNLIDGSSAGNNRRLLDGGVSTNSSDKGSTTAVSGEGEPGTGTPTATTTTPQKNKKKRSGNNKSAKGASSSKRQNSDRSMQLKDDGTSDNNSSNGPVEGEDEENVSPTTADGKYDKIETGFAKNLFLVESAFFQIICLGFLFPLDFSPWFGPNAGNATATFHSVDSGIRCVFNTLPDDECSQNALYYVLFSSAFALNNAGNVIISEFSAPLASMVGQIASPLTAIVLVIFPALSAKPQDVKLGQCVVATLMVLFGSMIFSFWEEMTSVQKREEEHHQHLRVEEVSSYGTQHDA